MSFFGEINMSEDKMRGQKRSDTNKKSTADKFAINKRIKSNERGVTCAVIIASSALVAGFCNAALGAGGGIILSFALSVISSDTASQNRSFLSLSQAAMIPCCLLSAIFYGFKDHFSVAEFSPYAVPAILGGITGALLLKRLRPQLVSRLFAALVIWSGIKMILG